MSLTGTVLRFLLIGVLALCVAGPRRADAGTNTWTSTATIGNSVWDLVYDDAGSLWAGTAGSGIYKSTDDGSTCTRVPSLPPLAVTSLSQSPVTTSKFLVADQEVVYRSTDSGSTWSPVTSLADTETLTSVAYIQCTSCQEAYFGSNIGVWKTTNGGDSWAHQEVGIGPQPVLAVLTHPSDSQKAWACTENGPYETTDGGSLWTVRGTGLENLPHAVCTVLAYNPTDATKMYLGTWYGLFRSSNSGQSWTRITALGENEYVTDIAVLADGSSSEIFVASHDGLYKASAGADTSWTEVHDGWHRSVAARKRTVGATTEHVVVASGQTTELYRSSDAGATWTTLDPVGRPDVGSLAVSPTNSATAYAVVGDRGEHWARLYKTTNSGAAWTQLSLPANTQPTHVATDAAGAVYVSSGFPAAISGVYRSTDGASTWTLMTGVPAKGWHSHSLATQVGTSGSRLGMQLHYLIDSDPWGDTYNAVVTATPQWSAISPSVGGVTEFQPAAVGVRGTGELWATGARFADPPFGTVIKSTNSGASWQTTAANFTKFGTCLDIDATTGRVFAGTSGAGLLYSTDGGATWVQSGGVSFAQKHVTSVGIPRSAGLARIWFASDADGVYQSTDGGSTWTSTGGLPSSSRVKRLAVSADGNTVYGGLLGDGVWHYQHSP